MFGVFRNTMTSITSLMSSYPLVLKIENIIVIILFFIEILRPHQQNLKMRMMMKVINRGQPFLFPWLNLKVGNQNSFSTINIETSVIQRKVRINLLITLYSIVTCRRSTWNKGHIVYTEFHQTLSSDGYELSLHS